jgi:hypothetical protein
VIHSNRAGLRASPRLFNCAGRRPLLLVVRVHRRLGRLAALGRKDAMMSRRNTFDNFD